MTDINSIIEMIEKKKLLDHGYTDYTEAYNTACDDIIEQLRKMSDWMPIDGAPKDGTLILIKEKCGRVVPCRWNHEEWGSDDWHVDLTQSVYTSYYPTMNCIEWMPIPK